jgi:hypothetical protein
MKQEKESVCHFYSICTICSDFVKIFTMYYEGSLLICEIRNLGQMTQLGEYGPGVRFSPESVIKTVFRERDGPFHRMSARKRKQLSYF